MTILTNSVAFNVDCEYVSVITTDYVSQDTPNGFLLRNSISVKPDSTSKNYYVDDMYFIYILVYNSVSGTDQIKTIEKTFSPITFNYSDDSEIRVDLFGLVSDKINISDKVSKDGYFTLYCLGIPKYELRSTDRARGRKIELYYDGTNYYSNYNFSTGTTNDLAITTTLFNDIVQNIKLEDFINNSNTLFETTDIFSTCIIGNCFNNLMAKLLKVEMSGACIEKDPELKSLKSKRDILFMIFYTLKYYNQFGLPLKAAKIISELDYCSNICKTLVNIEDCGCN